MTGINERAKELGILVVTGGPGGSGSSTISKYLANKWQLNHVYAGGLIRQKSPNPDNKSVTYYLNNLQKKGDNSLDLEIDKKLVSYSQQPNMLIESKTFAALATKKRIPCTIKIWITCNWESRINRALIKEGHLDLYQKANPQDSIYKQYHQDLKQRYENDVIRFKQLYNIDYENQEKYNDIVIDTTGQTIPLSLNNLIMKIKESPELRSKFPPKYLNLI